MCSFIPKYLAGDSLTHSPGPTEVLLPTQWPCATARDTHHYLRIPAQGLGIQGEPGSSLDQELPGSSWHLGIQVCGSPGHVRSPGDTSTPPPISSHKESALCALRQKVALEFGLRNKSIEAGGSGKNLDKSR